MKILARLFLKDRSVQVLLFLALLVNGAHWFILAWIVPHGEFLPLGFSVNVGINWSGPWWYAFLSPLIGLFIIVLNSFLGAFIFLKEKILSYALLTTALLAEVLLLAGSISLLLSIR